MNTQTRKLNLIEHLVLLQDEQILGKIEKFFSSFRQTKKASAKIPMSLEEFYSRIEASEKAIKEGKVISQEDLEKETQDW